MSRCEEYQELISRMVDGELTARQKAALQEHIRSCQDCAALYNAFSVLSSQIGEDLEEVPLDLRENVMAEIRREEIRRKNRIPAALRGVLAAAACVAVIMGISLGVSPQLRGRISAAAYPGMTVNSMEQSSAKAAIEFAEEPARYETDLDELPMAEEEAEIEDAAMLFEAEEAVTAEEAPTEDAAAEEPMAMDSAPNAGIQSAGTTALADADEDAGSLDFSGWMDLSMLRDLMSGEPVSLTREDLGADPAWTLLIQGEPGEDRVPVYVRDGLLYYWDPVEDAGYQAQLSPEEFEAFLNS